MHGVSGYYQNWWTRTAASGNSNNVCYVYNDGSPDRNNANNNYYVLP